FRRGGQTNGLADERIVEFREYSLQLASHFDVGGRVVGGPRVKVAQDSFFDFAGNGLGVVERHPVKLLSDLADVVGDIGRGRRRFLAFRERRGPGAEHREKSYQQERPPRTPRHATPDFHEFPFSESFPIGRPSSERPTRVTGQAGPSDMKAARDTGTLPTPARAEMSARRARVL